MPSHPTRLPKSCTADRWVIVTIAGLEEKNDYWQLFITFESCSQRETLNPEPISLGDN